MKTIIFIVTVALLFLFYFKKSSFNLTGNRFKTVKGKRSFPGIDMVYVISMPQRKEYITEQINKLGVTCTYFEAVKPSDLTDNDYNTLSNINDPRSRIYQKYTRLPVLLSFMLCFIDSLEKGYSTIVIFEDDMTITVSPELLDESLIEFSKSDIGVFYMGYCFLNCGQSYSEYKNIIEISDRDLLCCHAMAIKTSILPDLIKYCFPMRTGSDEMFRDYYKLNKIKVGVPRKVYFSQNRNSLDSLNQSVDDPTLFQTCSF